MGLRQEPDEDDFSFAEFDHHNEEDAATLRQRGQTRRRLEERLERKRLREEIDELDGEFDWQDLER